MSLMTINTSCRWFFYFARLPYWKWQNRNRKKSCDWICSQKVKFVWAQKICDWPYHDLFGQKFLWLVMLWKDRICQSTKLCDWNGNPKNHPFFLELVMVWKVQIYQSTKYLWLKRSFQIPIIFFVTCYGLIGQNSSEHKTFCDWALPCPFWVKSGATWYGLKGPKSSEHKTFYWFLPIFSKFVTFLSQISTILTILATFFFHKFWRFFS